MSLPRPSFIIGVTGTMDFAGYEDAVSNRDDLQPAARAVHDRVWQILLWARAESGGLDPSTGMFDGEAHCGHDVAHGPWPALGLRRTPIIVLSSLAPGIDTLVAEAALDFAAADPNSQVIVRAPLPFPEKVYRDSSSFCPRGKESTWAAKQARFDDVVHRIRKQPGFDERRDLFEVALDDDLVRAADKAHEAHETAEARADRVERAARTDLTAEDHCKPRRYLRYRAAGEFVATYSDLLLAAYDESFDPPADPTDLYARPGTRVVVEAKRMGLSYELLAVANNFAWADNGPVLHLPLDKVGDGQCPCARPLALLHPYDTEPKQPVPTPWYRRILPTLRIRVSRARPLKPYVRMADTDPRWQRAGDDLFRRVLHNQEDFNRLGKNQREDAELSEMLGQTEEKKAGLELSPAARAFVAPLREIASVRRRASDQADARDAKRTLLLRWLLGLMFVAAVSLGAFENWPQPQTHGSLIVTDLVGCARTLLLGITLISVTASAMLFREYLATATECRRYDWRAISEGLRVQFYWCLIGLHGSVAAEYMQRQRGELDWIRYVIGSLAFPMERWREGWNQLNHEDHVQTMLTAHRIWVKKQLSYFRKAAPKNEHEAHHWHHWTWTCAASVVLNVIGKFLCEAFPSCEEVAEHQPLGIAKWAAITGGALLLLALAFRFQRGERQLGTVAHDEDLHRLLRWGWAALHTSVLFLLLWLLPSDGVLWPDWHSWWIILTGVLLLSGGLCAAWSERNFFSEHARQYRAMESLFDCADRRLQHLFKRFAALDETSPVGRRTQEEIRNIFAELGREALDENAEWLILHRTRPLEPFMAA